MAARTLKNLGAAVIDYDQLSHEILAGCEVGRIIRGWWGSSVMTPSGDVDRAAVAAIVFEKPDELTRLEGLLYPLINRRAEQLMAQAEAAPAIKAIVLDAPKLFEVGLHKLCDCVLFVDAKRSVRLDRVWASRGWPEAELDRRENLLKPLDLKQADSDYTVVNHFNVEDLQLRLEKVFSSVLASFT